MESSIRVGMTCAEALALPAVVDVPTAARVLNIGRTNAYRLAKRGEFPVRVEWAGGQYRVPTAELLRYLGLDLAAAPERAAA